MELYKRYVVSQFGDITTLIMQEAPIPTPQKDEVLVKSLVAGVSFADLLMRQGVHPQRRNPPFTLGWDVVGEIVAVGANVTQWHIGQRVGALIVYGGYAEYVCVPQHLLVAIPEQVDPAEATILVYDGMVAYQMVHRIAKAQADEIALIHGAAGSVGTLLLQICRLAHVKTFGTASSGKHDYLRQLGAIPIDYKSHDFVSIIRQSDVGGVDMVFDGVGGWNALRSYRVLRPHGRLVVFGLSAILTNGKRDWRNILATILSYSLVFITNLFPFNRRVSLYSIQTLQKRRFDWYRHDFQILMSWLQTHKIKPVIAKRIRLEEVPQAHQALAHSQVIGKIVIQFDQKTP